MNRSAIRKALNPPGEIVDLEVMFISIVPAGANGQVGIAKALEGGPLTIAVAEFQKGETRTKIPVLADLSKAVIRKEDEAKQLFFCPVYLPDTPDAHGAWASAEVIEKAAHSFLAKGRQGNVDLSHDYEAQDCAVVESYVTKGADPMFPDLPEGSWVVGIKVNDLEIWNQIAKGELNSVSMGGVGIHLPPEPMEKEAQMSNDKKPGLLAGVKKMLGMETEINKSDGPVAFADSEASKEAMWTLDDLIWGLLIWTWEMFDGPGTPEEKLAAFKAALEYVTAEAAPLFMDAVEKGETEDENAAKVEAIQKAAEVVRAVITKALAVAQAGDDETLTAALADLEKAPGPETEQAIIEIAKAVKVVSDELAKMTAEPEENGDPDNPPAEPASAEKADEIAKAINLLSDQVEKMASQVAAIGKTVAPSKVEKDEEPPPEPKDGKWGVLGR
ncbi:MAG: hypothetical protein KKC37_03485 [Proteobacteria bacterium]|nr:hypothetical protein [Pseudomonadota bacterium]